MSDNNHGVIKVITWAIAGLAGLSVTTICILSGLEIQIPPELNTIASGLVGGILTMLTKTSPTPSSPNEMKIVNKKSDPVPTIPQK